MALIRLANLSCDIFKIAVTNNDIGFRIQVSVNYHRYVT
jgi:hypothetical protein